ncbi:MAG: hypothetical protein PHG67_06130 [Bacteroidales bacterium]|nr:hypothetical protein [Bacteroidales bacterium]HOI32701.1 hypothetical protein [Bacteroidales bacterium]
MVRIIKNFIFEIRLKAAIKKANKIARLTKYRCFVMLINGKPVVYAKKDLKEAIARGKFIKGFTIQQAEKKALYITTL